MRRYECPAGVRTTLIRNIAARGRAATFVLRIDTPVDGPVEWSVEGSVEGSVEVRHGPIPFFLGAKTNAVPLVDGLTVRRGFFDASFAVTVTAASDLSVSIGSRPRRS